MNRFLRFTALVTLAAFVGLSSVEAFHVHRANQTTANCSVCQVAHRTPTLITTVAAVAPHWVSAPATPELSDLSYVQFLFVSHGLSPPVL